MLKPLTTIVSHRRRSLQFGDNKYPGNCAGELIRDLIKYFGAKYVLDPSEGGGTTRDVCKFLGVRYVGYDLRKGDNLFDEPWLKYRTVTDTKRPDFIFWHPPYWRMIRYSKTVWNKGTPDPRDLSELSWPDFVTKQREAVEILYRTLAPGGVLAVLQGTFRVQGKFYRPWLDLIAWKETCEPEIIKAQFNTSSMSNSYFGHKFVPIAHEVLLCWRRNGEEG